MCVDDELDDTQTEPATGATTRKTLIDLVEAIEDSLDRSPRQPNSVVLDFQADQSVVPIRATDNLFVITGVFVRVVQQVDQHRGERIGISGYGR